MKRKTNRLKTVLAVVAVVLILVAVGVSYLIGSAVFAGSMQLATNESTDLASGKRYLEEVGFDLAEFQATYSIETVQIESTLDGHAIPADYVSVGDTQPKGTVVMVHGLGGNRLTVYPMAEMFLEDGYNVLAYDQRSSGENTAQYTAFGALESRDTEDCVTYLKDRFGSNHQVGLWGTSFGGATVGIYLGSDHANNNVSFAVLDCPVSSMSYMLAEVMEEMDVGIPLNYLMFAGNAVTKMKLGFSYQDAEVPERISATEVPVLVVNTRIDDVTPFFMGEDVYKAVSHGNKGIFTVEDSEHAEVFFDYREEYEERVQHLLESNHI